MLVANNLWIGSLWFSFTKQKANLVSVLLKSVLAFISRTAPETPMQRVGALVIAGATILSAILFGFLVADAWSGTWTTKGVLVLLFGLYVLLLLLPIGVVHGIAALFPSIIPEHKRRSTGFVNHFLEFQIWELKDGYAMIGWGVSVGVVLWTLWQVLRWVVSFF